MISPVHSDFRNSLFSPDLVTGVPIYLHGATANGAPGDWRLNVLNNPRKYAGKASLESFFDLGATMGASIQMTESHVYLNQEHKLVFR